jgi:hypothetical protein
VPDTCRVRKRKSRSVGTTAAFSEAHLAPPFCRSHLSRFYSLVAFLSSAAATTSPASSFRSHAASRHVRASSQSSLTMLCAISAIAWSAALQMRGIDRKPWGIPR